MPESKSPPGNVGWHEVVLRQKYNDQMKLKVALDEMYGQGKYGVKMRATRWILQLPEPIPEVNLPDAVSKTDTETASLSRRK
ncbi:hypothetical protein F4781DRAFT_175311 [Annulohypoxylon bovei var. microspora]|nr:hypothetical protein F4781DRAFT_175311 [Annulohypoxylon bovei var. microspora]